MPVQFTIRPADLKRATNELVVNRREHLDTDSADILVSECIANFRAVGTETEVPVSGKHPGAIRIPLKILQMISKVASTFKGKELKLVCENGRVSIGTWSAKHPDIEIGMLPDQRFSVPVDISILDTLALARILTPEQLIEQGMRARIEEAQARCRQAIAEAVSALAPLEIPEQRLQALLEEHLSLTAANLRKTLAI